MRSLHGFLLALGLLFASFASARPPDHDLRWADFSVGPLVAFRGSRSSYSLFAGWTPFFPLAVGHARLDIGGTLLKSSLGDLFLALYGDLWVGLEAIPDALYFEVGGGVTSWTDGQGTGPDVGVSLAVPVRARAIDRIALQYNRYFFGKGVNAVRLACGFSF